MFNKLRSRLILLTLGGTIFSILLVSIITNVTLFKRFDLYMRNEQTTRVEEVLDLIQHSYEINNRWTEEVLANIKISPLISSFNIEIRDTKNSLIFTHYMENTMIQMHNEMIERMGHGMMSTGHSGMMDRNLSEDNYIVEEYQLSSNNMKIGTVTVGHIGPFLVSEREIEFSRGMNASILYSAIISIFLAILMGMYSSRIISKPIIQITEAANHIRKGKLDTRIEIPNRIEELQELTRSINHLSKSLNDQELLRKRLTSDISHELRTPLTILQSHIEAISDGIWEPTQDKLDICKKEVIRLIKLVEELKNLTDIEKHSLVLDMQQYSISKELDEVVESFQHQVKEKSLTLLNSTENHVEIQGDRDKIKQILINLLSNAIKFTNNGGQITVGVVEAKGRVIITVKDTGIGIEEQDLPYIFERFYRSDLSRNRKTGGAGIGLTITKTLIEAHGGEIKVESEKDQGTKFTIILPQNQKKLS